MRIKYTLTSEMKRALNNQGLLGFDDHHQAGMAIINHVDFAERWDIDNLADQKTLEQWRTKTLNPSTAPAAYAHTIEVYQQQADRRQYVARFSDPAVKIAMGSDTIETPYFGAYPAEMVLNEIATRNPGSKVTLIPFGWDSL